jgi:hypothetical protein
MVLRFRDRLLRTLYLIFCGRWDTTASWYLRYYYDVNILERRLTSGSLPAMMFNIVEIKTTPCENGTPISSLGIFQRNAFRRYPAGSPARKLPTHRSAFPNHIPQVNHSVNSHTRRSKSQQSTFNLRPNTA